MTDPVGVSLQGPLAGLVVIAVGLFLLFAPVELLARKPSPVKRTPRAGARRKPVPLWMKVFFRGLGLALLALGGLLVAPLWSGA